MKNCFPLRANYSISIPYYQSKWYFPDVLDLGRYTES